LKQKTFPTLFSASSRFFSRDTHTHAHTYPTHSSITMASNIPGATCNVVWLLREWKKELGDPNNVATLLQNISTCIKLMEDPKTPNDIKQRFADESEEPLDDGLQGLADAEGLMGAFRRATEAAKIAAASKKQRSGKQRSGNQGSKKQQPQKRSRASQSSPAAAVAAAASGRGDGQSDTTAQQLDAKRACTAAKRAAELEAGAQRDMDRAAELTAQAGAKADAARDLFASAAAYAAVAKRLAQKDASQSKSSKPTGPTIT
jgi:hypothetical protein